MGEVRVRLQGLAIGRYGLGAMPPDRVEVGGQRAEAAQLPVARERGGGPGRGPVGGPARLQAPPGQPLRALLRAAAEGGGDIEHAERSQRHGIDSGRVPELCDGDGGVGGEHGLGRAHALAVAVAADLRVVRVEGEAGAQAPDAKITRPGGQHGGAAGRQAVPGGDPQAQVVGLLAVAVADEPDLIGPEARDERRKMTADDLVHRVPCREQLGAQPRRIRGQRQLAVSGTRDGDQALGHLGRGRIAAPGERESDLVRVAADPAVVPWLPRPRHDRRLVIVHVLAQAQRVERLVQVQA